MYTVGYTKCILNVYHQYWSPVIFINIYLHYLWNVVLKWYVLAQITRALKYPTKSSPVNNKIVICLLFWEFDWFAVFYFKFRVNSTKGMPCRYAEIPLLSLYNNINDYLWVPCFKFSCLLSSIYRLYFERVFFLINMYPDDNIVLVQIERKLDTELYFHMFIKLH